MTALYCPNCGARLWDTAAVYQIHGETVGCEKCVRRAEAWEARDLRQEEDPGDDGGERPKEENCGCAPDGNPSGRTEESPANFCPDTRSSTARLTARLTEIPPAAQPGPRICPGPNPNEVVLVRCILNQEPVPGSIHYLTDWRDEQGRWLCERDGIFSVTHWARFPRLNAPPPPNGFVWQAVPMEQGPIQTEQEPVQAEREPVQKEPAEREPMGKEADSRDAL